MKKAEAIKWMTDYIMTELSEDRAISIGIEKNMIISSFPSCVTASFGTRELFRALDTAMNRVIDRFHEQGKKVYNMKSCSTDGMTLVYFANAKEVEQEFRNLKNTVGIPRNVICVSNTPDIKLD